MPEMDAGPPQVFILCPERLPFTSSQRASRLWASDGSLPYLLLSEDRDIHQAGLASVTAREQGSHPLEKTLAEYGEVKWL